MRRRATCGDRRRDEAAATASPCIARGLGLNRPGQHRRSIAVRGKSAKQFFVRAADDEVHNFDTAAGEASNCSHGASEGYREALKDAPRELRP